MPQDRHYRGPKRCDDHSQALIHQLTVLAASDRSGTTPLSANACPAPDRGRALFAEHWRRGAQLPLVARVGSAGRAEKDRFPSTPVARSAGPWDLHMVEDEEGSLSVRPVTSGSSDRADVAGTKASTTSFIIFQDFELSTGRSSILLL